MLFAASVQISTNDESYDDGNLYTPTLFSLHSAYTLFFCSPMKYFTTRNLDERYVIC